MDNQSSQKDITRERLLDEGERLFAEYGYDSVSVRRLTQAAGANLSAINYYFQGKEGLYLEVFRSRWIPRAERIWAGVIKLEAKDDLTPEILVRTILNLLQHNLKDEEEHRRHMMLMMRERLQPKESVKGVLGDFLKMNLSLLVRLLKKVMPNPPNDTDLLLSAHTILMIGIHAYKVTPMLSWIAEKEGDSDFQDVITEHAINFSLKGLGINIDGGTP